MTEEQIIKELECRIDNFSKSVLDLINRQKAEILELQKRIINWRSDMDYRPEQIKSEARKAFAERLKENVNGDINRLYALGGRGEAVAPLCKFKDDIDNLVKEMESENK